jgi:hypothetical protein
VSLGAADPPGWLDAPHPRGVLFVPDRLDVGARQPGCHHDERHLADMEAIHTYEGTDVPPLTQHSRGSLGRRRRTNLGRIAAF